MAKKEKIIGIDLGTSNSAASVLEAGRPKIIPSAEGVTQYGKAFPSVVAFTKDGQLLVGEPAKRQAISNTANTIVAAKRKMGTNFKYKVLGKEYTPQQISAFILQKIKKDAESYLGEPVNKAVITVPAYFDDNQRQATKDAGEIAGLEVVRIINEPTAASLAYGLGKDGDELKILVFDLGGGTLDCTIMEFGDGVFEVKSTSGDTQLGGTDMDNAIVDFLVKKFKDQEGVDLSGDEVAMQRLREAGEKSKIELSTTLESQINLPFLTATDKGPKHFQYTLKRSELDRIVEPIVQKCKGPINQAIKDAKLKSNEVDKIILVGGPTRMPIVQKFVEDTVGKKVERGIDPMESVAQGAAIQGGVLAGEVKDVLLLDVTPLSLGIETLGGVFTNLIPRNTTVPTKKSQVFSTAADNQNAVTIRVGQGERPMFTDNKTLGQFDLLGIPPAPRGVPQIEVTFDIDANGLVHVTAKDLGTGKEQSIKITAAQKLNDEEIERMKKEAEAHADQDLKRKEKVEVVNEADTLIYSTEKLFTDFKDKVDAKKIEPVQKMVDELKELMKPEEKDIDALKSKMEEINKLVQEISTEMYQKVAQEQQAQQAAGAGAGPQPGQGAGASQRGKEEPKEKVVDAEVVEDDDEKKKE